MVVVALLWLRPVTGRAQCTAGWQVSGSNIYNCIGSGVVGIGTSSPTGVLDVVSPVAIKETRTSVLTTTSQAGLILKHQTTAQMADTFGIGILFQIRDADGVDNSLGRVNFYRKGGDSLGQFSVMTPDGTERFVISPTGNVGIGTTSPTAALNVVGDVVVTGNIGAKYQDIAEWVPSGGRLESGTVVVLDPNRPAEIVSSHSSYDTRVAGVVSAEPGVVLGEAGADKSMIATTGRVRVRVDATWHAIHVGDLLVTSGEPGMAMKSEPVELAGVSIHRPGTILGKALENMEKGRGEIMVLLSLQ